MKSSPLLTESVPVVFTSPVMCLVNFSRHFYDIKNRNWHHFKCFKILLAHFNSCTFDWINPLSWYMQSWRCDNQQNAQNSQVNQTGSTGYRSGFRQTDVWQLTRQLTANFEDFANFQCFILTIRDHFLSSRYHKVRQHVKIGPCTPKNWILDIT